MTLLSLNADELGSHGRPAFRAGAAEADQKPRHKDSQQSHRRYGSGQLYPQPHGPNTGSTVLCRAALVGSEHSAHSNRAEAI